MQEGEFWNNLESFVDKKKNTKPPVAVNTRDTVGNWLKTIPSKNNSEQKNKLKSISAKKLKKEESDKDSTQKTMKKKSDSGNSKRSRKCLLEGSSESVKRLYVPRLFINKKTKFKSKNKKPGPLFFGPVVECKAQFI